MAPSLNTNDVQRMKDLGLTPAELLEHDGHQAAVSEQAPLTTAALTVNGSIIARTFPMLSDVLKNGAWANAPRVFILGGGPSLAGWDWSRLEGEICISINKAFMRAPWAAINFSMDYRFLTWLGGGELGQETLAAWRTFQGLKVFTVKSDRQGVTSDIHAVPGLYDAGPPSWDLETGITTMGNSGTAAMYLAAALGAKEIYLMGFDGGPADKPQSHWHEGYPAVQSGEVYQRFSADLTRTTEALTAAGIDIWRVAPKLTVKHTKPYAEAYPKGPKVIRDDWKPLDRPTIFTCVTEGTAYETEAIELVRSAHAFGLNVRVFRYDDLGSWHANVMAKPSLILQAMREVKGPVLFVDADTTIQQFPLWIDTLNKGTAAFACGVHNWADIEGTRRTDGELHSALVYARPGKVAESILEAWAAECQKQAGKVHGDQDCLPAVLGRIQDKSRVAYLPTPAMVIPDLMGAEMAARADTVAHQASRRLYNARGPVIDTHEPESSATEGQDQ